MKPSDLAVSAAVAPLRSPEPRRVPQGPGEGPVQVEVVSPGAPHHRVVRGGGRAHRGGAPRLDQPIKVVRTALAPGAEVELEAAAAPEALCGQEVEDPLRHIRRSQDPWPRPATGRRAETRPAAPWPR